MSHFEWKVRTTSGDVTFVKLTNSKGAFVVLSQIGAGVVALSVPDRRGVLIDVAMGYESAEDYLADDPNSGKTAGRFANRICHGNLKVAGKEYKLETNCGEHHLHGGTNGFQRRLWEIDSIDDNTVVFSLLSLDGDSGYPGNLWVRAKYTWDDECRLSIVYEAKSDAETVVNLTNHTYFNLAGHNSGTVLDHLLTLNSTRFLEADETMGITGRLRSADDTPMDFRFARTLGDAINADYDMLRWAKGYDQCWVVDGYENKKLRTVATLTCFESGCELTVSSTQPGVQVYTGNWLGCSAPNGKGDYKYNDYDCVAIECQGWPDSPNHPDFPQNILRPGELYVEIIEYKFDVI